MNLKAETLYFRDIKRYQMLSEQEERELIVRVQDRDSEATDRLITANLRFVVSIAQRYRGRGLSFLELINEGNMGLLKAAKRFDLGNNVKFISYAVWWVRQSIQKALFDQTGIVRIPPNKITLLNKFKQALDRNSGDYAKAMQMDEFKNREAEIVEVMERVHGVSMDAPINTSRHEDDGVKTLADVLGEDPEQDSESARKELNAALDSVLQHVSGQEERILRMYYGLNFSKQFTLEEIGTELQLTRERVRIIRDRSLRKLLQNPESRSQLTPFFHDAKR